MGGWVVSVITVITALGGSATIAAVINAVAGRPKVRAEAVVALTDAAIKQVNELQEEIDRARASSRAAQEETHTLRTELTAANKSMLALERSLERLVSYIHDPLMTIERLREYVPARNTGRNGTTH